MGKRDATRRKLRWSRARKKEVRKLRQEKTSCLSTATLECTEFNREMGRRDATEKKLTGSRVTKDDAKRLRWEKSSCLCTPGSECPNSTRRWSREMRLGRS